MSVDEKSIYYDAGGIETINIIKAKLTDEQFEGFCLGNAIKYNCRYNFKHDDIEKKMRDIEKALNCLKILREFKKEKMHCCSLNFEDKTFTTWIENSENKQE